METFLWIVGFVVTLCYVTGAVVTYFEETVVFEVPEREAIGDALRWPWDFYQTYRHR